MMVAECEWNFTVTLCKRKKSDDWVGKAHQHENTFEKL